MKKKKMSKGSPEALARYVHPLLIYKQKYVCIFFHPPIPEKCLLIPTPLKKIEQRFPRGTGQICSAPTIFKQVCLYILPSPPSQNSCGHLTPPPPPPPKKKKMSTLKKNEQTFPLGAGKILSPPTHTKTKPFVYRNRVRVTCMQYVNNISNYMSVWNSLYLLGLELYISNAAHNIIFRDRFS